MVFGEVWSFKLDSILEVVQSVDVGVLTDSGLHVIPKFPINWSSVFPEFPEYGQLSLSGLHDGCGNTISFKFCFPNIVLPGCYPSTLF